MNLHPPRLQPEEAPHGWRHGGDKESNHGEEDDVVGMTVMIVGEIVEAIAAEDQEDCAGQAEGESCDVERCGEVQLRWPGGFVTAEGD